MPKIKRECQEAKLQWLMREYDCQNLNDLIQEAKKDPKLNRLLRECGIQLPKQT